MNSRNFLFGLLVVFGLLGCGSDSSKKGSDDVPPAVPPSSGSEMFYLKVSSDNLRYEDLTRGLLCSDDSTKICPEYKRPLNLILKDGPVTISWKSSNPDIISDDGVVQTGLTHDATVQMTATFTMSGNEMTKVFNLKVRADNPALDDDTFVDKVLEAVLAYWPSDYLFSQDRTYGIKSSSLKKPLAKEYLYKGEKVALNWSSDVKMFTDESMSTLVQSSKNDIKVNLKVTVKRGNASDSRIITLTILKTESEDKIAMQAACDALASRDLQARLLPANSYTCAGQICIAEFASANAFDMSTIKTPQDVKITWKNLSAEYLSLESNRLSVIKRPRFRDRNLTSMVSIQPLVQKSDSDALACAPWNYRLYRENPTKDEATAFVKNAFSNAIFDSSERKKLVDLSNALNEVGATFEAWNVMPAGYINGQGDILKVPAFNEQPVKLSIALKGRFADSQATETIFATEISLLPTKPTAAQSVEEAWKALTYQPGDKLMEEGLYGTNITWKQTAKSGDHVTDNVDYIESDGRIYTIRYCFEQDINVTLTATVSRGGFSKSKNFTVLIPAKANQSDEQIITDLDNYLSSVYSPLKGSKFENLLENIKKIEFSVEKLCGADYAWKMVDQNPVQSFSVSSTQANGIENVRIDILGGTEVRREGILQLNLSKGNARAIRKIPVSREKDRTDAQKLDAALAQLSVRDFANGNSIYQGNLFVDNNLVFPASFSGIPVTWTVEAQEFLGTQGQILKRPDDKNQGVNVTATLSLPNEEPRSKTFKVYVTPPEDSPFYQKVIEGYIAGNSFGPQGIGSDDAPRSIAPMDPKSRTSVELWLQGIKGQSQTSLLLPTSAALATIEWKELSELNALYNSQGRLYASAVVSAPTILRLQATYRFKKATAYRIYEILVSPEAIEESEAHNEVFYLSTSGSRPEGNTKVIGYSLTVTPREWRFKTRSSGWSPNPDRYVGRISWVGLTPGLSPYKNVGYMVDQMVLNTANANSYGTINMSETHEFSKSFFSSESAKIDVKAQYQVVP
jgi:hypothetical protein